MGQISNDFLGTERFRIRRRLGSGGMGVVYEAHDRETDKVVALKTLTRAEASHISRFKNEFRSLADVSHPNLVALYEFMSDGQYWFFTMELVQGVNFLEYVRPGYHAKHVQSSRTPTLRKTVNASESDEELLADYEAETQQLESIRVSQLTGERPETPQDPALAQSKLDLGLLNVALRQLVEGLHGLHETGKLHRDIKPSNVLVTKEGRVVILDFGLVAEVEGGEHHDTLTLAGTPDYMSPEQGAQLPISRASDWYSVGVMLYQALTGRLPFSGKFFEVMMNKQNFDPPAPSELVKSVPPELNDLCMRLLRRKPDERPTGREVLRILGHGRTGPLQRPIASPAASVAQTTPFIGRERQLRELANAFNVTRRGQTVTVYVHGSSGMGKTAVARYFLDLTREQHPDVVILEGRCYERESVPYKALDGVVDSLTKYLMSLPEARAEALMPREVMALARLFPVMLQVDAVFNAPQREHETPDPFTLRRKGFAALRELLGRICDRQPLVLYIDDLQWSDADSTSLVEDLLRPPDSPPLLLLSSFRSEDLKSKPFLKSLLEKSGSESCREVLVGALSKSESYTLLHDLLGSSASVLEPFADAILGEARGNPFLLEQLARYALTSDQTATTGITLAVMLDARLRHLPKGARQFIDALAVAGRPINPEVAYQAAELSGDELPLVTTLRAAQFLRTGGAEHTLELYHDRIREALAAQLEPKKVTQIHRRLAQALEARGIDDPEALFEHYLGAGERVRAATHAAVAAKKAASALAFDRAAAFFRRALELAPARDAELVDLKRGLADALVNAGRPAEAAQAYLDLAQLTSARHSLDFKRRAAQQLLMGGHINEGLELIRSVLAAIGLTYPAGPRSALFSLILKRIQIRVRGLSFTERDEGQIPEFDLVRVDTCYAVAAGLGSVDLIRGADFQSRHLLLALRAGEPYRIARAMAFEAAWTAARGGAGVERAAQIARQAEELANKVGHPHAIAISMWARGVCAYLAGTWQKAAELCEVASEVLRDRCTGVTWELTVANRYKLSSLLQMGELVEVSRRVPALLSAALEQGNLFAAMELRTRLNLIWLVADDPDKARGDVIEALKSWPQVGFHLQHYVSLHALTQIELYTGDTEVAWKHVEGQWPALEDSLLLRTPAVRVEAMQLRARTALATSAEGRDDAKLRLAEKLARKIEKVNMSWSKPFATLIRATIAHQRGEAEKATTLLSEAVQGFERAEMHLHAAAARRRLGERLRDERGKQLIAEADAWMVGQKIKKPEAMTRMIVPGF
ncbi:MAG TPA: protein kinase [Pyrinomonadaceae bacterium]|jgi:serine/threonine protein kinase/tetratricopeptide (TPR) repeat protein|nr:protein kinase [Pyrinomonadaceae bacterium]